MLHATAAVAALFIISTFFVFSLVVEILGHLFWIKTAKTVILCAMPLLLIAMPTVAITGNKLAGNSCHPSILFKQRRMKFIVMNGMVLVSLATYLYYRAHYQAVDDIFFYIQLTEFALGFVNLVLMVLNIKEGLKLSGRMEKRLTL